jgi:hypothetical protein
VAVGILDDLNFLREQHKKVRCALAVFLDTLDPEDCRQVEVAFDDSGYTSRSIYRVLQTRGWDGGETTVSRHRRRECVCGNF